MFFVFFRCNRKYTYFCEGDDTVDFPSTHANLFRSMLTFNTDLRKLMELPNLYAVR